MKLVCPKDDDNFHVLTLIASFKSHKERKKFFSAKEASRTFSKPHLATLFRLIFPSSFLLRRPPFLHHDQRRHQSIRRLFLLPAPSAYQNIRSHRSEHPLWLMDQGVLWGNAFLTKLFFAKCFLSRSDFLWVWKTVRKWSHDNYWECRTVC